MDDLNFLYSSIKYAQTVQLGSIKNHRSFGNDLYSSPEKKPSISLSIHLTQQNLQVANSFHAKLAIRWKFLSLSQRKRFLSGVYQQRSQSNGDNRKPYARLDLLVIMRIQQERRTDQGRANECCSRDRAADISINHGFYEANIFTKSERIIRRVSSWIQLNIFIALNCPTLSALILFKWKVFHFFFLH